MLRSTLVLVLMSSAAISTASAETISREVPRAAAAVPAEMASTSPESTMPYSCAKTELKTRIERRSYR